MNENDTTGIRLVVIGDKNVGKTCMLMAYTLSVFPEDYVPKVFDNCVQSIEVDGASVDLALCDTLWEEEHDKLRPRRYPEVDVVLIVFSVVDPCTLANATERWVQKVEHFAEGVPIILVGAKTDLREDEGLVAELSKKGSYPITVQDGVEQAAKIDAVKYMECSSLKQTGLKEIFEEAARVVLNPPRPKLRGRYMCLIL